MLRKTLLIALLVTAVCGVTFSTLAFQETKLSERADRVVQYLLGDWQRHMHSTSIAQAMESLDIPANDDLRMEIGEHFRNKPDLHFNLRSWGANNYILSDEEKRIAKQLVNAFDSTETLPSLEALSRELELPTDRIRDRLDFLKRTSLLVDSAEASLGYDLTDRYRRWAGPLRMNYHTISVGDEHPYGVW